MRTLISFANVPIPSIGLPDELFYIEDLRAIKQRGAISIARVRLVFFGGFEEGVIGVDERGDYLNDPRHAPQYWLGRPCPPYCDKLENIRNWRTFEQAVDEFPGL